MVATAPGAAQGWLDPFLADRGAPGRGEPRDVHEPGDRPLPADDRRVDAGRRPPRDRAAAAAQPAWAETSYQERAAVLRRAAEIYEAHRPSSARGRSARPAPTRKMHHEQNFTVNELLAASTMPWQPYG